MVDLGIRLPTELRPQSGSHSDLARPLPVFTYDQRNLIPNAAILREMGVPPELALQSLVATNPPPLPTIHLSRVTIFSGLAREFDTSSAVAVTGYPDCGKTIAMAEFAAAAPGRVLWFSVAQSTTHPEGWCALLGYALANYLGAASILPADIQDSLLSQQESLLVVIDNAQNCHSLDAIDFLFDSAAANKAVSLLIVATDSPDFLSKVRCRAIPEWRLPGLQTEEAKSLVNLISGPMNDHQEKALEILRRKVDGHAGMLRLSHVRIRQIDSAERLEQFLSDLEFSLGTGLEQLRTSMMEIVRGQLNDDDIELCRRLSLAIRPFRRKIGEAVWQINRESGAFHKTWASCSIGLFQADQDDAYSLPDIYRDALRNEVDSTILCACHGAIADAMDEDERARSVSDIEALIAHRLFSGSPDKALRSAAMYLVFASGPYARLAQIFLIDSFSRQLSVVAEDSQTAIDSRIHWFAISTRVYRDINQNANSNQAAAKLYSLLLSSNQVAGRDAIQLGWMVLLIHASQIGKPTLALEAASQIADEYLPETQEKLLPWIEFAVLSSFLDSDQSPFAYLRSILEERRTPGVKPTLWNEMLTYEFWRLVAIRIYRSIEAEFLTYPLTLDDLVNDIRVMIDLARITEPELATLFQVLLVQVQIDFARDFGGARVAGASMVEGLKHDDVRLMAYAHDTYGDALRCDSDALAASEEYSIALEMWPESEQHDRAETHLMYGISIARLGRYAEARKNVLSAAMIHRRIRHSALSEGRCYLEAATYALHNEDYPRAMRDLVHAHKIIENCSMQSPEWVALGQLAWAMVGRLGSDPMNPPTPQPGFTIGLRDPVAESGEMKPLAPTFMMGRACAAFGSPNRAMRYFNSALSLCDGNEFKCHVGSIALDSAIAIEDLSRAIEYACWASLWLKYAPPDTPTGFKSFVWDYQVGRAIRLASIAKNETDAISQFDLALSRVAETGLSDNPVLLINSVLQAYRSSLVDNTASSLESAFQAAIDANAIWIAREIAWFWCFRYSVGRPSFENQHLVWHWRLCWLTIEMAPDDAPFLRSFILQELEVFQRLAKLAESQAFAATIKTIECCIDQPLDSVKAVVSTLAKFACKFGSVTEAIAELSTQLSKAKQTPQIQAAFDAIFVRMLDLILHPAGTEMLAPIMKDLGSLIKSLSLADRHGLESVRERFELLNHLTHFLQTGTPTECAFRALIESKDYVYYLSLNSAAQYYIMLRHMIEVSSDRLYSFEQVCQQLTSVHVNSLLNDEKLLPYLRLRLQVGQLCAEGFFASQQFHDAIAILRTQEQLHTPIKRSAYEDAMANFTQALESRRSIALELSKLKEVAKEQKSPCDVWSCCMELGGLERLTGTALYKLLGDANAIEEWIQPAIHAYREAVDAAREMQDANTAKSIIRAAFSALSAARVANDERAIDEFSGIIQQLKQTGEHNEKIAQQEQFEALDPIAGERRKGDRPSFTTSDEAIIQDFTNHIMSATGYPEERRKFVEDDIRKMGRINEVQSEYCRHLQPLQNLEHNNSPSTAYSSRTRYVAACSLLGYELNLEVEDLDTTIEALKRLYCENCGHRNPANSLAVDKV